VRQPHRRYLAVLKLTRYALAAREQKAVSRPQGCLAQAPGLEAHVTSEQRPEARLIQRVGPGLGGADRVIGDFIAKRAADAQPGPETVVAERDRQTDLVSGIRLVHVFASNFRLRRLELNHVDQVQAVIRHDAPPGGADGLLMGGSDTL
jgi:hypothetical protein